MTSKIGGERLTPQYLQLEPSSLDEKRWVAEITGPDPTFKLKREFQPPLEPGVWDMYDGWYQIHGVYPGITPFEKEYVRVVDGKMSRRIPVHYVLENLPQIIEMEAERQRRLRQQIEAELDDILTHFDQDVIREELSRQKDELSWLDNSTEYLQALKALRQRKNDIIKQYEKMVELMKGQEYQDI